MESDMITKMLSISLIVMFVIFFILVLFYIYLKMKMGGDSTNKSKKKDFESTEDVKGNEKGYNKQSIFSFMEFEDIVDNMIELKKGKKYSMVIECQGVNYDLMSSIEKVGVEEGFQQFLNTLRYPIQIYIQTRTVNLESSIETYKDKVKEVEDKYNRTAYELKKMKESGYYSEQQLEKLQVEMVKQKNLLDYGRDIIRNTENMSKNKNILNKKYYVVISYFTEELERNDFDKDELRGMAFSELYTRAQSLIRALSASSVRGRVLNSIELAELLYMAYNRDEAETYNIEKAIRAGLMDMYSVSQDIFEKKIKLLDEQIENGAIDIANDNIQKAKTKLQEIAEKKANSKDVLMNQMAKRILEDNKEYIGEDIAEQAILELSKQLESSKKTVRKGAKNNEEIKK